MFKKALIIIFMLFTQQSLYARIPNTDYEFEIGMYLYKIEKASWIGTDFIIKNYPTIAEEIGGYVSYIDTSNHVRTAFYSKENESKILIRFIHSYTLDTDSSILKFRDSATLEEKLLIHMRHKALLEIQNDTVGFFEKIDDASLNVIPIIYEYKKSVYVISSTLKQGYVLLGGDYELHFDNDFNIVKKEKLYSNIELVPFYNSSIGHTSNGHYDEQSKLIDPTDICTLLLYADKIKWNLHFVVGKKYVSVFNIRKKEIMVITRKNYDSLYGE